MANWDIGLRKTVRTPNSWIWPIFKNHLLALSSLPPSHWFRLVLVFFCCIICYHKLSVLKRHLTSSHFVDWLWGSWILCWTYCRLKSRCSLGWVCIWRLWGKLLLKLFLFLVEISFFSGYRTEFHDVRKDTLVKHTFQGKEERGYTGKRMFLGATLSSQTVPTFLATQLTPSSSQQWHNKSAFFESPTFPTLMFGPSFTRLIWLGEAHLDNLCLLWSANLGS